MRPVLQIKSESSFSIVDLVTTDKDKKFEQPARMAEAIIRITQEQGDCLPQDLNPEEFPAPYVARYWHMANAMANVELGRIENEPIQRIKMWNSFRQTKDQKC